jgi:hypothetical protein
MGRRHASAQAGVARAQADEAIREAEARRESAERERQLLTSYLGSADQVAGTGRFSAQPEVLKYTQRYSVDARSLLEGQAAGSGVKGQIDPFLMGGRDVVAYGQGFADQANDLLAQAEAAARAGDVAAADRLYSQAQSVIGGLSTNAQYAFNLGGGEESNAAIRASSAEGRIVGRQLLTAGQLQDPNSATSAGLRGRLLDPSLAVIGEGTSKIIGEISAGESAALGEIRAGEEAARGVIDENTRNAERAIAAERGQIDGEIRQRAASGGGAGVNARAQLALQTRAGAEAGRARADVYSKAAQEQGRIAAEAAVLRGGVITDAALARAETYARESAQRAVLISDTDRYLNEFAKRMAEDSVRLSQEWVNGTAGVRDIYQDRLMQLDIIEADMRNQWARFFALQAEKRRDEDKRKDALRREFVPGVLTGTLALASIFGGTENLGSSSGQPKGGSQGIGFGGSALGGGFNSGVGSDKSIGEGGGSDLGDFGEQGGGSLASVSGVGAGGGGGGGSLGTILSLFA